MSTKPLSPYLRELVSQRTLPETAAWVVNRLPDWKQQKKVVEEMFGYRMSSLAAQVVADYEEMNRDGDDMPCGADTYLDLELDEIKIVPGLLLLEETVEYYLGYIKKLLLRAVAQTRCPYYCGQFLIDGQRHYNCAILSRYSNSCENYEKQVLKKPLTDDEHKNVNDARSIMDLYSQAFKSGVFPDGRAWSVPRDPKTGGYPSGLRPHPGEGVGVSS